MRKMTKWIALMMIVSTLTTAIFAAPFTPSVEQKQSPEVVAVKDETGKTVAAVIVDEKGKTIEGVKEESIVVVPLSQANEVKEEVKAEINAAYASVVSAGSLEKAAPSLAEALAKQIAVPPKMQDDKQPAKQEEAQLPAVKMEDLVIRDMVYVSVEKDVQEKLGDNAVEMVFKMDLEPTAFLSVIVYSDGEWVVIPPEMIEILPDGTVRIKLNVFGVLAFVVEKGEEEAE